MQDPSGEYQSSNRKNPGTEEVLARINEQDLSKRESIEGLKDLVISKIATLDIRIRNGGNGRDSQIAIIQACWEYQDLWAAIMAKVEKENLTLIMELKEYARNDKNFGKKLSRYSKTPSAIPCTEAKFHLELHNGEGKGHSSNLREKPKDGLDIKKIRKVIEGPDAGAAYRAHRRSNGPVTRKQ